MEQYKIIENTPFGFVFEICQEGCYYTNSQYEIYLNGKRHGADNRNVAAVFGLRPDTRYAVEIRGIASGTCFEVRTEKVGYLLDVREYNAAGDGISDDTAAVNAAIYTAPPHSVVRIPAGTYKVNQVFLKSGVDLYLEKGAVLLQNADRAALAILRGYQKNYGHSDVTINASWEGHPLDCYCSLLYGKCVHDVRIYGEGALDGNGEAGGWWENPKGKDRAYRPRNVFLAHCRRIALLGLTSRNSAAWNIHPFYCRELRFYCLGIASAHDSPNTDGLNPESCEDVAITGCRFRVGDDCIAIKSGKYYMGRRHFMRTKHVIIRNCFMEKGHGGVVIGSEIACGVEDVQVGQCYFKGTDRGLRIKTRRGRGNRSVVKSVRFADVRMEDVPHCFVINMFYHCDPDGHSDEVQRKALLPADARTPSVEDIRIARVDAHGVRGSAVFIYGLPESRVKGIAVRDCRFRFAAPIHELPPAMMDGLPPLQKPGFFICNGEGISMSGNVLEGSYTNIINGLEATK